MFPLEPVFIKAPNTIPVPRSRRRASHEMRWCGTIHTDGRTGGDGGWPKNENVEENQRSPSDRHHTPASSSCSHKILEIGCGDGPDRRHIGQQQHNAEEGGGWIIKGKWNWTFLSNNSLNVFAIDHSLELKSWASLRLTFARIAIFTSQPISYIEEVTFYKQGRYNFIV